MTSPRRLAVLAATLLTTLLSATAAHAAVPGINVSGYTDAPAALSKGAKQIRFFVPWKNFEPSSAADFTAAGPTTSSPYVDDLKTYVARVRAAGATPIMVVLDAPDWAAAGTGAHLHPRSAAEYSSFMGELAAWIGAGTGSGPAPVYEVWNEEDAPEFWGGTPDAAFYTSMLTQSYAAVKASDPSAVVLTGPTTGNNYAWIDALYANGAGGSFDGVSVHTDTACSVASPDTFYRDPNGRLGQFTFLGYRGVHDVMAAHGDGGKGIWMTEIGWNATNGGPTSCASGDGAGKKPSGVDEASQAKFLTKAFVCMANDPYLVSADWFTYKDDGSTTNHFGLLDSKGGAKPALAAFQDAGKQTAGDCGDFAPPALNVVSPTEGQQFVDKLDISANATDNGVGLARISYAYDNNMEIRNFTDALKNGVSVGLAPWQNSGKLALGPHTISVTALDANGNTTTKVVHVTKVAVGSIASSLTPLFKLPKKAKCKARTCTFAALLSRGVSGRPSIGGKVAIEWQFKNKKGKFRKLVGGLKPASKALNFKAKLKFKGTWRVRLIYKGVAPYKSLTSKYVTFRVK